MKLLKESISWIVWQSEMCQNDLPYDSFLMMHRNGIFMRLTFFLSPSPNLIFQWDSYWNLLWLISAKRNKKVRKKLNHSTTQHKDFNSLLERTQTTDWRALSLYFSQFFFFAKKLLKAFLSRALSFSLNRRFALLAFLFYWKMQTHTLV